MRSVENNDEEPVTARRPKWVGYLLASVILLLAIVAFVLALTMPI